jgi:hypothetical protein
VHEWLQIDQMRVCWKLFSPHAVYSVCRVFTHVGRHAGRLLHSALKSQSSQPTRAPSVRGRAVRAHESRAACALAVD